MAERNWPSSEFVHDLIEQLDEAVRNAERVRRQVEDQMRRRTVYPDRRSPRHWQRVPDADNHAD
jgi:hypothetical protein